MRVIKTKHFPFDGYKDISFEEEAHINDDNLNYISKRKHYTWTKYLGINSSKTA